MFEDFFDQIDKGTVYIYKLYLIFKNWTDLIVAVSELGPLNPDWFEELTAKACRDDEGPDISKDEEDIKAPEISALDTQLFSTPKIFKQHFQSPDSMRNEDSPYEGITGVVLNRTFTLVHLADAFCPKHIRI